MKAAGLKVKDLTPHKLRHTTASLAIAAGADVKVIQQMLGHADAAMTLNIYGHLSRTDWPRWPMCSTLAGPCARNHGCRMKENRPGAFAFMLHAPGRFSFTVLLRPRLPARTWSHLSG